MRLIRQRIGNLAVIIILLLFLSESSLAANLAQQTFPFPAFSLEIGYNADHQLIYYKKNNSQAVSQRLDNRSDHDQLNGAGIQVIENRLHLVWTSTPIEQEFSQIRYSVWDGSKFSKPMVVHSSVTLPSFSPYWLNSPKGLKVAWYTYTSPEDLALVERRAILGSKKWLTYSMQAADSNLPKRRTPSSATTNKNIVMVNLGDSIAAGWKCQINSSGHHSCTQSDRDKHGQQAGGYVPRSIKLINQYMQSSISMFNEGVGGDTTSDLRVKLNGIMNKYPGATHAFILSGANDGSTTGIHLRSVLQSLLNRGITPIVSTVTPEAGGRASKNLQIVQEAETLDVMVNDTYNYLIPFWNTGSSCNADQGDHLHISYCGDELIAESLLGTFKKLYPKPNISAILQLLLD